MAIKGGVSSLRLMPKDVPLGLAPDSSESRLVPGGQLGFLATPTQAQPRRVGSGTGLAISCPSLSLSARTTPAVFVARDHRATVNADRLGSAEPVRCRPLGVDLRRYWLDVIRVDTGTDTAQVIKLQALRNRAVLPLVEHFVCVAHRSIVADLPVSSFRIDRALPYPAWRREAPVFNRVSERMAHMRKRRSTFATPEHERSSVRQNVERFARKAAVTLATHTGRVRLGMHFADLLLGRGSAVPRDVSSIASAFACLNYTGFSAKQEVRS